jgi:DNA-binding response OmpR family regulator
MLRAIPVIAVTSYGMAGDDEKARAAGCDGYISKPYSPRQLLAMVREYLSGAAARRSSELLVESPNRVIHVDFVLSAICPVSGQFRK